MPDIVEEARVTAKGQVTIPKSIRQKLGVSVGESLRFREMGDDIVVERVDPAGHHDPVIADFLDFLERDLSNGLRVKEMTADMAARLNALVVDDDHDLNSPIDGSTCL